MASWSLDTGRARAACSCSHRARPDTTLRRVVWSDPAASGLKTPSEKSPTHASRPDLERAAMASLAAPHNLKMCLPSVSSVPVAAASSFDPTSRSASRPRLLLSPNDRGLQTPRSGAASAECVLAPDQRLLLPELVLNVCDTTRTESVAEGKMPKRLASPLLKGKRLHQHLQHSRTRARQSTADGGDANSFEGSSYTGAPETAARRSISSAAATGRRSWTRLGAWKSLHELYMT